MERIEPKEGVIYTQNIAELPIEDRIFFKQGFVSSIDNFRLATPEEMAAWEEWKKKEEEKSISDLI